jgi:RNA polymerase sigma-70 factor (ECF subfamily)
MTEVERESFQHLVEPYRRELRLHCYRMLGSLDDAEDLVQETYLRAWRGFEDFEGRASVRSWLYRIATNACLNALARRRIQRRVLTAPGAPPSQESPPSDRTGGPEPATENLWLDPFPDSALEGVADTAPGPAARYELREGVQLAFVAAIQQLPPRQRAVVLLHDVLGWSAAGTAVLLESSVTAVYSALQRARGALERRFPEGVPASLPAPDERERALLDRYVSAWEGGDLDRFVALLREDAVLSMPPLARWYLGPRTIGEFFEWAQREHDHPGLPRFRFVRTGANAQPAFAVYVPGPDGSEWRALAIQVLSVREGAIGSIVAFLDTRLFAAFGLPAVLPAAQP